MSEITEQKQTLREALLVITNAAVVPSISLKAVKAAKDATVLLDAVKMELDHYGNEVLCLDDPRFPFGLYNYLLSCLLYVSKLWGIEITGKNTKLLGPG